MIDLEKVIVLEELFSELEYEFGKKGDISVRELIEFLDDRFDTNIQEVLARIEGRRF